MDKPGNGYFNNVRENQKEVRDKISFEGHNEDLVLKRTNIRTRLKGEQIKSGFICFIIHYNH